MSLSQSKLQENARYVHEQLKGYYDTWLELEKIANDMGMTLDTKTAELKPKN